MSALQYELSGDKAFVTACINMHTDLTWTISEEVLTLLKKAFNYYLQARDLNGGESRLQEKCELIAKFLPTTKRKKKYL